MDTLIQYAIAAGAWIVDHTLIPYPMQTTAALALVVVVMAVWVGRDLRRRS